MFETGVQSEFYYQGVWHQAIRLFAKCETLGHYFKKVKLK